MKRVSLKDIARMVGVSPSTVSFVLNGKAADMRISEAVAARIEEVAEKEGYYPNQLAVSLRTGQSKIIGLVVESISGAFFGSLAKVIEEEAEKLGYKVVYCSTENEASKGKELIRMLSQRQVDGYLITPASGMEKDIQGLIAHDKKVVFMDSYFPNMDVPYVVVDNYEGVTRGMEHLVKKGYRRIGFVTVDLDLVQIKDRRRAYVDTLKAANITFAKKRVLSLPYNMPKKEVVEQISDFLEKQPDLDALFFATNYLGIAGLESLRNLKKSIPGDVAVICFDDHDIFNLYQPGITAIQQPVEKIAKTAIQLLMSQIRNKKAGTTKKQVHLAARLVVRESV